MYFDAMHKSGIRIFNVLGDKIVILKKEFRNREQKKYNVPIDWLVQKWTLTLSKFFYVSIYYYIIPFVILFNPMWLLVRD